MAVIIGLSSTLTDELLKNQRQHLADENGLATELVEKAMRMAENKTLKWVESQFKRQLAGHLSVDERVKITTNILKTRIRAAISKKNGQGARLWMGVSDIDLRRFGQGRASGDGYTVDRRHEKGAFSAAMQNGHEGIYRRVTSRRLPITAVTVPIAPHAWGALENIMNQAEDKLMQELKQALKYLMLKKAGVA